MLCGQGSVWWIAALDCNIGSRFFGEWPVGQQNITRLFTCLFFEGWSNSRPSFGLPRSKQFPVFFLDARCFSRNKRREFLFYYYYMSVDSQNTTGFWSVREREREREREMATVVARFWTRLFDLGIKTFWVSTLLVGMTLLNTQYVARLPSLTSHTRDILLLLKILRLNSCMNFNGWSLRCLEFIYLSVCVGRSVIHFIYQLLSFI